MKAIRFIPVAQLNDPMTITLGISGASGTGKTYSALRVARGIARAVTGRDDAQIGFIDTENRRALHYAEEFPEMVHYDMRATDDDGNMVGFSPERWIEVIDAAEAAKIPVMVIDSFSHEWEGVGGILDLHATTLDRISGGNDSLRDKRSQLAWAEVKPRHRRLVDRIVRAKTHIIICTRAKPVMQDPRTRKNARKTKTRMADVPWDIASDGDLLFEMTAMFILDPDHPGKPVYRIKAADQVKAIFNPDQLLDERTGEALVKWSNRSSSAKNDKAVMDDARLEAGKGRESFIEWWKAADKPTREICRPIMQELERLASEADRRLAADDDDPFSRPGPDDDDPDAEGPTEEQREAAMEEARRAVEDSINKEQPK